MRGLIVKSPGRPTPTPSWTPWTSNSLRTTGPQSCTTGKGFISIKFLLLVSVPRTLPTTPPCPCSPTSTASTTTTGWTGRTQTLMTRSQLSTRPVFVLILTELYFTILYCTVLCYSELRCTELYNTEL